MKKLFIIAIATLSFSTFASSIIEDLDSKQCELVVNKSVTISKKNLFKDVGSISLSSLYFNKNIKLRSGSTYDILDESSGTIGLDISGNLIFMCVVDNDECLSDLSSIQSSDIKKLSNNVLELNCH